MLEQLEALVANSRIGTALKSWTAMSASAWQESGLPRILNPIVRLDLTGRMRVFACITVTAVVANTVLLAALGVPMQVVGWSLRMVLLGFGVIAIYRPLAARGRSTDSQIDG
jgi:hypothetical protein